MPLSESPSLYTVSGERKYLNASEREAFEQALTDFEPKVRTFGLVLLYTGFRISEVLSLTVGSIDLSEKILCVESLKKRRRGVYRAVPVPERLLVLLGEVHGLPGSDKKARLWAWSRATASLRVRAVMLGAGVEGERACARGLRHSFGIACMEAGIPAHMLQKWLGHAHLETTAIYATAVGVEERNLASRLWGQEG